MNNPTDTNQASGDRVSLIPFEMVVLAYMELAYESTDEARRATESVVGMAKAIIRAEKLKLLDRLSSHQEDLFWWTGGEYEKTKAVDMRAIASERAKLKEVK